MAETLRFLVSIVVAKRLVLLSAVIPCQLEKTLAVRCHTVLARYPLAPGVAQEVQVEAMLGAPRSSEQGHAQDLLIELERLLGVFHSEHGVVLVPLDQTNRLSRDAASGTYHLVCANIGSGHTLCLLERLLAHNFYPISVRIQSKSDVTHPAVAELLVKLVPGILNSLTCLLDIIYADADMAKSSMGLDVAVVDLEASIILCAVVVGQLDDTLSIEDTVP